MDTALSAKLWLVALASFVPIRCLKEQGLLTYTLSCWGFCSP